MPTLAELYDRAAAAGITGYRRLTAAELAARLGDPAASEEGATVVGVLALGPDGEAALRAQRMARGEQDVRVGPGIVRRLGLRAGDLLEVVVGAAEPGRRPRVERVVTVNGSPAEAAAERGDPVRGGAAGRPFAADAPRAARTRAALALAPLARGHRGLIAGPARAVSNALVELGEGLAGEAAVVAIVPGAPPERLAAWEAVPAVELAAAPLAAPADAVLDVARLAGERAVRRCEAGDDVVLLVDTATGVARAADRASTAPARIGDATLAPGALDLLAELVGRAGVADRGSLAVVLGVADDVPGGAAVRTEMSPLAAWHVALDPAGRVDPHSSWSDPPADDERLRAALAKSGDPAEELAARAAGTGSVEELRRGGARRRR